MGAKKIFISGPITGHSDYFDKFRLAEKYLKSLGYVVVNPAYLPEGLDSQDDYMDICYTIIDKCDELYMLDGWENSDGARKEKAYATSKNMDVRHQSFDKGYMEFVENDPDIKTEQILYDARSLNEEDLKKAISKAAVFVANSLLNDDPSNDEIIEEMVDMQAITQVALSVYRADPDEVHALYNSTMQYLKEVL